jgi:hypothetical protein
MQNSRFSRSLLLAGSILSGLTGCALDAQTDDEARSTQQAFTTIPGDKAFAYSTNTTGTAPSHPSFTYSSGAGTVNVTHIGTGQYRVDFPNLGNVVGGDVQVMPRAFDLTRCKVNWWQSAGSTLQVYVNCFAYGGAPVNSTFTVNYVRRSDLPGPEAAYVWAYDPSSASYDASAGNPYAWNSTGSAINITHAPGSGTYNVSLPGQDMFGGTVEVTAYGGDNAHCKVVRWNWSGVTVACFNGSTGAETESRFTMLFSRKSPNGTPSSSYAWANQPSNPSYIPDPTYRLGLINVDTNSDPSVVSTPSSIQRFGTGRYRVTFPGMASIIATPANVKVTAYGSGSETCKAHSWGRLGSTPDAYADLFCFSASGALVDTYYTIIYSSLAFTIG